MLDDYVLNCFMQQNQNHRRLLVLHLGRRGFYAEVTTVARTLIYAWVHQLQLVLDCRDFAYSASKGWNDYFLPFCREYTEDMEPQVVMHSDYGYPGNRCKAGRRGAKTIRTSPTDQLEVGHLTITGYRHIVRVVVAALFRLSPRAQTRVDRLTASLDLPEEYAGIHVRRGDKVNDEDLYYPAELYLERLGPLGSIDTLFVMSDDWSAVEEVRGHVEGSNPHVRVASLCTEEMAGFDCQRAGRGEAFMNEGVEGVLPASSWESYVFDEITLLLAETLIAARAQTFVSTRRSNVADVIQFLHPNPRACRMLTPRDVAPGGEASPPKNSL